MKIQLAIAINLIASKDNNDEEQVMHSNNVKIEIMINDDAGEGKRNRFKSLKNRYQNNLESMKGSDIIFDYVHLSFIVL